MLRPVPAMVPRGRGAGANGLITAIWRGWAWICIRGPGMYRLYSWLASRFNWMTPAQQGGWTSVRIPP